MRLIFSGHGFKYEVESICKLFFPCVKFELEYDTADFSGDNFIFTRARPKDKSGFAFCYAYVKAENRVFKSSFKVSDKRKNFEKECEHAVCTALYRALAECTGTTPQWGVLTGIRPVKRIQRYLDGGMNPAQIKNRLVERYLVSEKKAELAITTAVAQRPILKTADNFNFSLYVAIPFCPSRCSYCSFISQSASEKKIYSMIPEYLEYLYKELELTAATAKSLGLKLKTVYIGGGTPTVLSAAQITELTDKIAGEFELSSVEEYTIEAGRPDSVSEEKLRAIKAAGATRISINPQTLNDEVLAEIGRKHTVEQFFNSFNLARSLGFNNINTDLIAGLPKDSAESFKSSISGVLALSPENITVHTLAMKKAARLYQDAPEKNSRRKAAAQEMVEYALEQLCAGGYHPYYLYRQKNTLGNLENVGYSKAGRDCIYNVYIMEETQTILAVGASASTKLVNIDKSYIERVFNYKYPFEYMKHFDVIAGRKKEITEFYAREFSNRYKEKI